MRGWTGSGRPNSSRPGRAPSAANARIASSSSTSRASVTATRARLLRRPVSDTETCLSKTRREHPAMSLEILGSILPLPDSCVVLQLGEDRGAGCTRMRVVCVDVVDRNVDAVDHVRRLKPRARLLTSLGVMPRALVVRARIPKHDHAAVELHVHVSDSTIVVAPPSGLFESERFCDPIG